MNKKYVGFMLAAILCSVPFAACSAPKGETENVDIEENLSSAQETIETPLPEKPEENEQTNEPAPPAVEIPEPEPQPAKTEYIKILANGLNVRSGAGTNYTSLGTVEQNILMKCTQKTGDWYQTLYRGKVAYVSANPQYSTLASLETGGENVESVIEQGLLYVGTPYVYGAVRYHDGKGVKQNGFTTDAFDCSSYMQYIFLKGADVLLNTTTRTQISQGKEIAKADIARGDLLFFTNASRKDNVGIERVGHVALYLGDNYILHTASDYAKVEQISSTRWSYFITARRVL